MAKFCRTCGMQLGDDASFCPGCGTKQAETVQDTSPQAFQPGQQQYAPPPQPGQQQYAPPPQGQNEGFEKLKSAFTNTKDETASIHPDDIAQNKMWGGLAYILFFLPLIGAPNSRYGRFHANQGLLFLILWIIVVIVVRIVSWIFLFSAWQLFFIPTIISVVLWIFVAIVGVIGLINGFTGKAKELPFIGKYRIIKY